METQVTNEPVTLEERSNLLYGIYKSQSTGTDSYHIMNRITGGKLIMTDGVRNMFEELQCYWLGDVIVSYYQNFCRLNEDFMTVKIIKNLNGSGCTFVMTDGDTKELITQRITYTDLKQNINMYLQFDGTTYCLMMPSEY